MYILVLTTIIMKKNKDLQKLDQAYIVKSHDVRIDDEYVRWIAELKHRYRSAQVKAAVKVNAEKLLFNWQLGRDLVQKKAEERWGTGVVEQLSLDLKREFPNDNGFSERNLWYMKQWYLFYNCDNDNKILQRRMKNSTSLVENFQCCYLLFRGDIMWK